MCPKLRYNRYLKSCSRELRHNMTDAERLLWSKIRMKSLKGYQFFRQRIIDDYIVDFYCPLAKLVIEVDGGQHFSEDTVCSDKIRDDYLRNQSFKVLRFTNTEVLNNLDGVLEHIMGNLSD